MEQNLIQNNTQGQEKNRDGKKSSSFVIKIIFLLITIGILSVGVLVYSLSMPPKSFTSHTLISIPSGYSLKKIGKLLEDEHVIQSQTIFNLLVTRANKEKNISSGDYLFKDPHPVWKVVERLTLGDRDIEILRITLPEGITVNKMANILSGKLPDFHEEEFLKQTHEKEGYLFPDTYFFYSTATSGPVVSTMEENFRTKTASLKKESDEMNLDWKDVITLASIVEKEAATAEDRRLIAGILKYRLSINMRLQVDAPFLYTIGKGSVDLTTSDLSSDSPYNTYRYLGLPPTPIGNPGADSILSVLHPVKSPYLFYLSDNDGVMHYAKTFQEHKINKAKYLK